MKQLILFLLTAVSATASDAVLDAINNATGQRSAPAVIQSATNWTIRTDTYTGPKGDGYQVVATLKSGTASIGLLVRNSGPETYREKLPSLAEFKAGLIARLDNQFWQVDLKTGITVSGITLSAYDGDRNAFTQLMVMFDMAELAMTPEQKALFEASQQTIADIAGMPHSMSVAQIRGLLLQYGAAYQQLWSAYITRKAQINAATGFAQL
jgi:hypothetical protein